MSTVTIKTQISSDELLQGVAQLDDQVLDQFVSKVLTLQAQRRTDTLSIQEGELLEQINLGISAEAWGRYDVLRQKRRAEKLTAEEHQELLNISNQLEILNVQRMTALVKLATLRNVSLEALMDTLGIVTPNYE